MNNDMNNENEEIAVLFKLQKCKQELQKMNLTKSGHNNYGHYNYYELDDIIPHITSILLDNNMCSKSYQRGNKMYLTIYDLDSSQSTSFNTKLKEFPTEMNAKKDYGTYMKNQQGLQTYARRALWLMALDIVEPNDIEADKNEKGSKIQKSKKRPARVNNQEVPTQTTITTTPKQNKQSKLTPPDAPVTTEKIKEILDTAYQKVAVDAEKEFTLENADWTIRRLCNNQKLYKACIAALESRPANLDAGEVVE